ncbi:MAG: type I secretion system permease/ATPase [Alphaproteobacteria bacterium]
MQPRQALARAVAGSRRAFWIVGVFSLGVNLLMLTVPVYMMQMFDRVVPSRNVDTLLWLSLIAVVALGVMAALEGVRGRLMVRLANWFDRELSGPLLAGAFNDSLRTGGARGAQPLRDLAQVRATLTGGGLFPLFDAPWVPIFIVVIFLLHWHLGIIAVVGGVIVFACAMLNDVTTREPLKEANAAGARSLYRADAVVRNADVVAAMGMMTDLVRRWGRDNEGGLSKQIEASDRANIITSSAKLARMLVQIGMLGYGAWLVTLHELTGGGMIAASIILGRAMAPLEQSIGAWRGLVAARSSFRNICELLERTPAVGEGMKLPVPTGRLSVEALTFVPPGSREPLLRNVGFQLQPAEVLGLIGASAAGKTTLARLLVGSWEPTAGHVRLDGADVAGWEAVDRGRHVGYLPQDVELFEGTIRENIARLGEASDEAVVAAAELAGVHEMILRLPQGYDTQIGEGGLRLSGGQRQRIALARAVFGTPRLIVLDEPNSNLDNEGELALTHAIRRLQASGTTIVIIAHRPSILSHVDKLLVLRQGMVEAFGPRDEIMAKVAPGVRVGPRPSLVATVNEPGGRPA